jgi:hypothetical protein
MYRLLQLLQSNGDENEETEVSMGTFI